MQNNLLDCPVDLEFEISGEKLTELEWTHIPSLDSICKEIAHAIHRIILKKAWEIVSIEELKCQIIKNLNFIDLIKVKLEFSGKSGRVEQFRDNEKLNAYNTISDLPTVLSNNLFGWVYYNENDTLKTFRFILNISTGEIKYLNN